MAEEVEISYGSCHAVLTYHDLGMKSVLAIFTSSPEPKEQSIQQNQINADCFLQLWCVEHREYSTS